MIAKKLGPAHSNLVCVLPFVLAACGACGPTSHSRETPAADQSTAPSGPWLQLHAASGIDFHHQSGYRGGDSYRFPEIMSGGAALFDMDQDGDLDAYLVQGGPLSPDEGPSLDNRLFENLGGGQFRDVTEGSGSGTGRYGNGVAAGDYDNDGDVDLYVTNLGPNTLLENLGDGTFAETTAEAGVGHPGWGTSASFLDFDRDGDLDLFVVNYVGWRADRELRCYNDLGERDYCGPTGYDSPAGDVLYRNDGPGDDGGVSFSDVSASAGLDTGFGNGLGLVSADFNGDHELDVFVANDAMADQLWFRQPDGTFRDDALIAGCAADREGRQKAGMGVSAADFDDDGDLDILVGNLTAETDTLFRNDGGLFLDTTLSAGLGAASRSYTRFGLAFQDFDNDSLLDIYQANGRVKRQSEHWREDDPYAEPNLLFRGVGGGVFSEVTPRGGLEDGPYGSSRAAAFGDIDNDGGVDVLVVNRDGAAQLLLNIVSNRGHWLILRLVERQGRDAYHATVRMTVAGRRITRVAHPAYSYQASNDSRVHIGLGDALQATEIEIVWLDGSVDRIDRLAADRVVEIRQGSTPGQMASHRTVTTQ